MNGIVNSINISSKGGVPKTSIEEGNILFHGLEGDFNKFLLVDLKYHLLTLNIGFEVI